MKPEAWNWTHTHANWNETLGVESTRRRHEHVCSESKTNYRGVETTDLKSKLLSAWLRIYHVSRKNQLNRQLNAWNWTQSQSNCNISLGIGNIGSWIQQRELELKIAAVGLATPVWTWQRWTFNQTSGAWNRRENQVGSRMEKRTTQKGDACVACHRFWATRNMLFVTHSSVVWAFVQTWSRYRELGFKGWSGIHRSALCWLPTESCRVLGNYLKHTQVWATPSMLVTQNSSVCSWSVIDYWSFCCISHQVVGCMICVFCSSSFDLQHAFPKVRHLSSACTEMCWYANQSS